ncbi:MAG TPA: acyl-CoA dehydrogenase family protein [Dehalococcoidia bacterium]|nr:acyl-CoA dehydrogenase family protein [Dehalococcoidia bacterium]
MDFSDTPEQARFRQEVRDFLRQELPKDIPQQDETVLGIGLGEDKRDQEWLRKLGSRGWVAPAWPKEYGGAGLSVIEQFIFNQEMARAGAPRPNFLAVAIAGPTIMVHGTEEQKAQHLPGILSGEVYWCQGFSEPGSGSDLASLHTSAVKDGDDYIINGTKIWTTGAHRAQRMMLLARTDPDAPKHKGISYFLLDMKSPGVTVRPLVNMADVPSFNQVFFDNVRVPASDMLGAPNQGWYVATTSLDFERSSIMSVTELQMTVSQLAAFVREPSVEGRLLDIYPAARLELADRAVEAEVGVLLSYRVASLQDRGLVPNYEASMTKLYATELAQRITRTGLRLMGPFGIVQEGSKWAALRGRYARMYLMSVASTIAGGTSEVQRQIIATRGIGLPRGD